jgi:hypothetical protein
MSPPMHFPSEPNVDTSVAFRVKLQRSDVVFGPCCCFLLSRACNQILRAKAAADSKTYTGRTLWRRRRERTLLQKYSNVSGVGGALFSSGAWSDLWCVVGWLLGLCPDAKVHRVEKLVSLQTDKFVGCIGIKKRSIPHHVPRIMSNI